MNIAKISSILAALAMSLVMGNARAEGECDNQEVIDIAGLGLSGSAKLCSSSGGLKAKFRVHGLQPGDAYTGWWVYFDDPSLCTGGGEGICGDPDFAPSEAGGGTPLAVFGRFVSTVGSRSGNTNLSGNWGGMQPSSGSQIWLLLLSHGPANYADGRHLARQLLTPEDPLAGIPHLGNHIDGTGFTPVAISIHDVE
jgi:hypothetical protein